MIQFQQTTKVYQNNSEANSYSLECSSINDINDRCRYCVWIFSNRIQQELKPACKTEFMKHFGLNIFSSSQDMKNDQAELKAMLSPLYFMCW